jgi:hypothetical protein
MSTHEVALRGTLCLLGAGMVIAGVIGAVRQRMGKQ